MGLRASSGALMALALLGCRSPGGAAVDKPAAAAEDRSGTPCGPLDCRQYDTLAEAFESTLASHPRVVAVGEAHRQKGVAIASAATRFTEHVLPKLAGRASDLLVELMSPPSGCDKTTVAVRKEHEVVTRAQAPENQSEYVTMGERARALGIVPDLLRPSCADLGRVNDAGDDAVAASLEMIARLTARQAERLVGRDARSDADHDKMVVLYGGALHNDLTPPKERAAWSFGPELDSFAGGRYVAVELFVPELIDDSPGWKEREFTRFYDPARLGAKTTVYRQGKTFVLVLPRGGGS